MSLCDNKNTNLGGSPMAKNKSVAKNTDIAQNMIVQSNNLIEAFYDSDLTATEHKIIRYAASKIKKKPDMFPNASFTVVEFLEAAGIKSNSYHERIEKVAEELTRKRIKIKDRGATGYFPYLQALIYNDGMVHLTFNSYIKDMILELDKKFTGYDLKDIGDMRSGYSIRMFELLKQYAPIGRRTLKVETLKKMLGIGNKYEKYAQFKLRVLTQAKKELDKKEDLTFTFDEVKEGRKVVELIFHIKSNKPRYIQSSLFNPSVDDGQFIKEANYLLESYPFNIAESDLVKWVDYDIDFLREAFDEVKDREMGSPFAYISTVLKSKQEKTNTLMSELKTKDKRAVEMIYAFVEKNKNITGTTIWYVEEMFERHMIGSYSIEEIRAMWDSEFEFINSRIPTI